MILGSGAFGLEAMEAADRAGAASITLIVHERDRHASAQLSWASLHGLIIDSNLHHRLALEAATA